MSPVPGRERDGFDGEEILAGICDWVRVESPTTHVAGVDRMMDLAAATMAALGADVERLPGEGGFGDVVRARIAGRGNGPGILVLGHLDTVHLRGTIDGPLRLRRDGDRMYGPGIYDMKGGLYLACHAMRRVVERSGRPALPVTFLFIPDEEVGSPSTRALIEAEARRHAFVLVPEPAKGDTGRVVTGRHAFLRYRLRVHGRPAHAGADNRIGRSAIRAMAGLIERIEGWSDLARGQTYSVGVVQGGTFVNVVPIECRAEVLCVAPTVEDMALVRERMDSLAGEADGVRVEVEAGPVRPLFRPHPGTLELFEKARAIAADLGFTLEHGQFGGGSDGNFTGALGIPTLDGLGVMGNGAHTHDEHCLVSSLAPRARLLAGLFERLG
ncbi:MAG: M20/M25/M40 family metallo-hydrolase [Alphaproteobacteria bacterium]|nr:M20/M25/M40 family metallo-hydrolase [Alphaproteobacteria bacterium]